MTVEESAERLRLAHKAVNDYDGAAVKALKGRILSAVFTLYREGHMFPPSVLALFREADQQDAARQALMAALEDPHAHAHRPPDLQALIQAYQAARAVHQEAKQRVKQAKAAAHARTPCSRSPKPKKARSHGSAHSPRTPQREAIETAHRNPDAPPLVPVHETWAQRMVAHQLRSGGGVVTVGGSSVPRKDQIERLTEER